MEDYQKAAVFHKGSALLFPEGLKQMYSSGPPRCPRRLPSMFVMIPVQDLFCSPISRLKKIYIYIYQHHSIAATTAAAALFKSHQFHSQGYKPISLVFPPVSLAEPPAAFNPINPSTAGDDEDWFHQQTINLYLPPFFFFFSLFFSTRCTKYHEKGVSGDSSTTVK